MVTNCSGNARENHPETPKGVIRIVIADDHPITRYGLAALLAGETDFEVVGEAASGRQALDRVCELDPDILLLELHIPSLNGMSVSGMSVLEMLQEAKNRTRTLVLTGSEDKTGFVQCMKLGAFGVIRKQATPQLIIKSIRTVSRGETWLDSELTAHVLRQFASFNNDRSISHQGSVQSKAVSARELSVVQLIAQGFRNKEIADKLFISEQTVKNHLHCIFRKLGVSDRLSLALYAVHQNIFAIGPERAVDLPPAQTQNAPVWHR